MSTKFALILLLLGLTAWPASGQVKIVGRVIDDMTETPLAATSVTLLTRDGYRLAQMETSETGTFEFEVHRAKAIRLRAERLGFQSNTTPILYFDARKFFQVEIRLDPDAILLAPLEVVAWSARPMNALHEGYKRRLAMGLGRFITREEVEKRNPTFVTDLLREVPGVRVVGSGSGLRPKVELGRSAGKNCVTQIYIDGFLMNRHVLTQNGFRPDDVRIDDVVSPRSVEGIEIYGGMSTVPAEFLNPDADCGVIAIWTRRGGEPPPR